MAAIGLTEASKLTGRNRSTLHRAMKTGRLSYTKTAAGERRVEVAELERVFGIRVSNETLNATLGNGAQPVKSHAAQRGEVAALREGIERQDATIADLRATIAEQNATIRSIQAEKQLLLALLTGPRRPWWRRWFR